MVQSLIMRLNVFFQVIVRDFFLISPQKIYHCLIYQKLLKWVEIDAMIKVCSLSYISTEMVNWGQLCWLKNQDLTVQIMV